SGRVLTTLQAHAGGAYSVALSRDGRLLASGGADGAVRLWEVPGGRPLATVRGHTRAVYGLALSADSELLASGGIDGTVRLWETQSSNHLRTLRPERRYERMDITGLTGVTEAQRLALIALGAVERGA